MPEGDRADLEVEPMPRGPASCPAHQPGRLQLGEPLVEQRDRFRVVKAQSFGQRASAVIGRSSASSSAGTGGATTWVMPDGR